MEQQLSKDEQIKAAYALNLCTVSVSQIIDYDDIIILEQEYEAILNNLNLENMPHDEALLNILKQLMDTITYFRMSEIDKQIAELEYSHKMKNAIWSAMPNLGSMILSGNPLMLPISLAAQIGTGYMNYRRAKAEIQLEATIKHLQLQRTAIEQFNGLRRELFDTAWRLADTYHFSDELRLSERQIRQYDMILMDADPLRKFDRLDAVKNDFKAYPPFWYYFANTANEISRSKEVKLSEKSRHEFRQTAISYYDFYWEINKYPLLREDQMASACALEYADILIEDGADQEKTLDLIRKAEKMSGRALDIYQLCSVAYLRVDAVDDAVRVLRYLVNEDYNTSVNAQILSALYIRQSAIYENQSARAGYEVLSNRVDNGYLIPWPEQGQDFLPVFVERQRNMILRKFRQVLGAFRGKYSIQFNKILPPPVPDREYPESYFTEANKQKRLADLRSVFSVREKRENYLTVLCRTPFSIEIIDTFNEMWKDLAELKTLEDLTSVTETARKMIHDSAEDICELQELIQNGTFTIKDCIRLHEYTFDSFRSVIFIELDKLAVSAIKTMNDMRDFSAAENDLSQFCRSQGLPEPESVADRVEPEEMLQSQEQLYFSYELLGSGTQLALQFNKRNAMIRLIKEKASAITTESSFARFVFPEDSDFDAYFTGKKSTLADYRRETLAILDEISFLTNCDLVLTENGILVVVKNILKEICTYEAAVYDESIKEIRFNKERYYNKHVQSDELWKLFGELNRMIVEG